MAAIVFYSKSRTLTRPSGANFSATTTGRLVTYQLAASKSFTFKSSPRFIGCHESRVTRPRLLRSSCTAQKRTKTFLTLPSTCWTSLRTTLKRMVLERGAALADGHDITGLDTEGGRAVARDS